MVSLRGGVSSTSYPGLEFIGIISDPNHQEARKELQRDQPTPSTSDPLQITAVDQGRPQELYAAANKAAITSNNQQKETPCDVLTSQERINKATTNDAATRTTTHPKGDSENKETEETQHKQQSIACQAPPAAAAAADAAAADVAESNKCCWKWLGPAAKVVYGNADDAEKWAMNREERRQPIPEGERR